MVLSDLLKSVSASEDMASAAVIASLLNADALARFNIGGRAEVMPADVIRFGKVLGLYADMRPAGEGAEAFRKPSTARPPAPGPVTAEQAAA